jgi:tetratricopeptide (TPR) repeat protein
MGDTTKNLPILGVLIVLIALCALLVGSLTGAVDFGRWRQELGALRSPEEDTDRLWQRAQAYYVTGNTEWAIMTARRITLLDPRHKESRKLLAAMAQKEKDYNTAALYCREALSIDETDMTAMIGLGNALKGLKQYKQAKAAYEKAILSPYSVPAHRSEAQAQLADLVPFLKDTDKTDAEALAAPAGLGELLASPVPSPSASPAASPSPSPSLAPVVR